MSNQQPVFPRQLCGALLLAGLAGLPGLAFAAVVNLVQNDGFETGDFSGWTEIGDTIFNGVQCPGPALVPQGNCDAFFGPVGTTGGIQQSLATTAGSTYFISFVFQGDGDDPSSFQVDFGAQTLLSLSNPAAAGFQTFSFFALATAANTVLKFQFRDDAGFLFLDNVQVAVPEPASLALLSLGLAGLGFSRRRSQLKI